MIRDLPATGERRYSIGGSALVVRFGDILQSGSEVLVSSDDFRLSMGGGVSAAILRAAGSAIVVDAAKAGPRQFGDVVVTTAGALDARYVFHVVSIGPDGPPGTDVDRLSTIRAATSRCLVLAHALGTTSIAFPAIGAGVADIGIETVAVAMIDAIHAHLRTASPPMRVELHLIAKSWQSSADYISFFEAVARRLPTDLVDAQPDAVSPGGAVAAVPDRVLDLNKRRAALEEQLRTAGPGEAAATKELSDALAKTGLEMVEAIDGRAPLRLFLSYSHDDRGDAVKLLDHLSGLRISGLATWSDRMIAPGSTWNDDIDSALEITDIAVFLISSSFLASPYCVGKEWERANERRAAGELQMVPVLLRACDWQPLVGALQIVPSDGVAVRSQKDIDEAMLGVVRALKVSIERRKASTHTSGVIQVHALQHVEL